MAHKKKHGTPVPPGNRPQVGPADATANQQGAPGGAGGSPFQDQDAKRRIGDFEGAGEHARQQPSAINDGQQHSR
jgi:hypothetical protein